MKNQTLCISVAITLVLSSCSPRFYTPNVIVTPTFKKAGDIYFNANYNIFNKGSMTFGYAFTDHFGAYTNLAINMEKHTSYYPIDIGPTDSEGGYLSLGFGYFRQSSEIRKKGLEFYGEYARGLYDVYYYNSVTYNPYLPDSTRLSNIYGKFNRFALILNLNENFNKLSLISSFRFSAINFTRNHADEDMKFYLDKIYYRKIYPTIEYGLTCFYGKHRLKFMTQYNVMVSLNSKSDKGALQAANVSLNLGFVYKLIR